MGKNWTIVASGGGHTRQVNGILGLLCKEHFLGLVEYARVTGLAYSFDHYAVAPDAATGEARAVGKFSSH